MSLDDLSLALSWAEGEGWNPGIDDAAPFFAADPHGFLMGWLGGERAVAISAVAYGGTYGFIGLYICRPDLRGHAYGASLVRAALARLEDRPVGIDGVMERVENYERLGFRLAHRNMRYGGTTPATGATDPRIRPIEAGLASEVAAFDRAMFGCPRDGFIRAWLTPTPTRSGLALLDGDTVAGYGVIRDCAVGHKIGPLFARTAEDADALLPALAALRPGGMLFLDVPQPNAAAVRLAERHGFAVVFETARMYRGGDWPLPLDRTFGITTFELG